MANIPDKDFAGISNNLPIAVFNQILDRILRRRMSATIIMEVVL
jgi:hypothetical protein